MPIAPLDAMKNLGAEEKMLTDDRTTVSDYLVLGTWDAITLLGQAGELCGAGEISDMIAKAEAILISVVSELPPRSRCESYEGCSPGVGLGNCWLPTIGNQGRSPQ